MGTASRCSTTRPRSLVLGLALLLGGCADDGAQVGTERGPCYPNSTCNAGLTCLSGLCVRAVDGAGPLDAGPDLGPTEAGADLSQPDAPAADTSNADAADHTPPTVTFTDPADGDTTVEPDASITVLFSEAMAPASLDETTFTVSAGGETVAGTISTTGSSCTFVPDQPLSRLVLHAVEIGTGATDLAGNPLAQAHAFSFVTRDRRWLTAERLEIGSPNAERPQVAMDASGNAIAVWSQYAPQTTFSIWASPFSRSAAAWDTPKLVETNEQGNASAPQVAMDASGNAVAVFWQFDGVHYNIWGNRYRASNGTWGTPQLIETSDAGDASAPSVAVDASGNAVVVFWQFDGARYNIWSNRYVASNGTWGAAELIETSDAGDASAPYVAINPSGTAVAVFWIHDGTHYNIWSNRLTAASGKWGTAELIEANDQGDATTPQVAVDQSGNAVAVWPQSDGTRYHVWANRYSASEGSWGTAAQIEANDQDGAFAPQVVTDGAGNAMAVWRQRDGARHDIWASRYQAAAAAWSAPAKIETNDQGDAAEPRAAMHRDGDVIVVWPQSDGSRHDIWANRYLAQSDQWGTPEKIETSDQGDAITVQLAIDPDGSAVAVWAQDDGTRFDIWGNRFD